MISDIHHSKVFVHKVHSKLFCDFPKAQFREMITPMSNLDSRANFSVAFPPLIFREAPYRGPSVREKERPGVEVDRCHCNNYT